MSVTIYLVGNVRDVYDKIPLRKIRWIFFRVQIVFCFVSFLLNIAICKAAKTKFSLNRPFIFIVRSPQTSTEISHHGWYT